VVSQAVLALLVPDRLTDIRALMAELVEAADSLGDPRLQVAAYAWSYGAALSAADPALDGFLDQWLHLARENGTYATIYAKWF